jgi:hypothetical protein
VVEVQDEEHHAEVWCELSESAHQSHRVRAAADRDADALAGADEMVSAQLELERAEHGNIIKEA